MIFYKNIRKHKSISEKNIVFSVFENGIVSNLDDSVSKPNSCKMCYNLICKNGSLKTGLGFRDFQVQSQFQI